MPAEREVSLAVHYRNEPVAWYRADLIVDHRVILELKTIARIRDPVKYQLYHYLRITRLPLGLLLNFGAKAQVVRVFNQRDQ